METKFRKALTLTLTNFSQESSLIKSPPFSCGGCEWIVKVYPKGHNCDNYLSVYLSLNEPKSLGLNWKRKADYYFVLLNQSREETYRTQEGGTSFSANASSWGFREAIPLEKVLEKEVLVNDSFTIEIYIKVLEVHGIEKEPVDVNGFQVLSSQVTSVRQIFVEHPDIALGFKSKNQVVKREYMNILLNLLEIVKKPLKSISETELSNAHNELCELTEVGFKLEWLKTKLEKVSLEKKASLKVELEEEKAKATSDAAKVLLLEKTLSNLKTELADEKSKSEIATANLKSLKEVFFELRVELEKEASLRVELEEEKAKATSDAAKVLLLEKTLYDLKTELANEKAKSEIATGNLKSLKEAFSELRVELEKEKTKSTRATSKTLSLKETWSNLKVKKDHKKGNSAITDNLLSFEDADLVSPTGCLGNGYKRMN